MRLTDPAPRQAAYTIRDGRPADLDAARALLRACDLPLDGLEEQFGPAYAVAQAGGDIIGLAGVEAHGPDGLLRSAAVAPVWRGRGVGEALTRDRLTWARQRRLRGVWLLTTTASGWFPRFGFVTMPREAAPPAIRASREFAEVCATTSTLMHLRLEPEKPR